MCHSKSPQLLLTTYCAQYSTVYCIVELKKNWLLKLPVNVSRLSYNGIWLMPWLQDRCSKMAECSQSTLPCTKKHSSQERDREWILIPVVNVQEKWLIYEFQETFSRSFVQFHNFWHYRTYHICMVKEVNWTQCKELEHQREGLSGKSQGSIKSLDVALAGADDGSLLSVIANFHVQLHWLEDWCAVQFMPSRLIHGDGSGHITCLYCCCPSLHTSVFFLRNFIHAAHATFLSVLSSYSLERLSCYESWAWYVFIAAMRVGYKCQTWVSPGATSKNINALSTVSDLDTSIHSIVEIGSRLHQALR